VPEVDELVTGGVWVEGVAEVPLFRSFVVPVLAPVWPEPLPVLVPVPDAPVVPVLPELIDEPVPESVEVPVELQAARDRAMMPPSSAVWNLFIRFLLRVDG